MRVEVFSEFNSDLEKIWCEFEMKASLYQGTGDKLKPQLPKRSTTSAELLLIVFTRKERGSGLARYSVNFDALPLIGAYRSMKTGGIVEPISQFYYPIIWIRHITKLDTC